MALRGIKSLKIIFAALMFCCMVFQMRKWHYEDGKHFADFFQIEKIYDYVNNAQNESFFQSIQPQSSGTNSSSLNADQEISPEELRRIIRNHNQKFEVYNDNKFGPVEYVIVVQVHDRIQYLEQLIQSLSKAEEMERTLLIFSHDYYSNQLNDLVKCITFCRVMQIFYPYSYQAYPDSFPGDDPRDCPAFIGVETAEKMKCQNWRSPDHFAHYRETKFTQLKHHWWWKMNHIFGGIPHLRSFTGWVLRLEEDHYVSSDFLHTFDYIVKHKEALCSECDTIGLGIYLNSYSHYSKTIDQVAVSKWVSSGHNMGMAIKRTTWNSIRSCTEMFCTDDDYNWDWSLMRVNLQCLDKPMTIIYTKSPRVFHVGDCGIHHKGSTCESSGAKIISLLENNQQNLFPDQFYVAERMISKELSVPGINGGWGDVRDHDLCRNISYSSSHNF